MDFRRARPSDSETLMQMMVDFNRVEGIPWRPEKLRPALLRLLTQPELGLVVIAEADGHPCGYFVLAFSYDLEFWGRDAFLTELYVTPSQRGRGIAKQLLAEAETRARAADVRAVHLGVLPDAERALSLYQKAGFERSPYLFLTKRFDA